MGNNYYLFNMVNSDKVKVLGFPVLSKKLYILKNYIPLWNEYINMGISFVL
jgi:hypothetical protein